MQKKATYPKDGLLIIENGSKWFVGQSNSWKASEKRRVDKYYFLQKGESCDRHKANACHKRAMFYGYETIGPRVYALYRCTDHGMIRYRLVDADGPEVQEYLNSKV